MQQDNELVESREIDVQTEDDVCGRVADLQRKSETARVMTDELHKVSAAIVQVRILVDHSDQLKADREVELKEKLVLIDGLQEQLVEKDKELVGLWNIKAQTEADVHGRVAELQGELDAARATADRLQSSIDKVSAVATPA